jgi:hypothetical protein
MAASAKIQKLLKNAAKAQSLAEYVETVTSITKAWNESRAGTRRAWFRGHADKSWGLQPRAHRMLAHLPTITESHHFGEFKRRAAGLIQHAPQTDWGWLYLAQHHGLPTRLLDWSEGSLTGLFFALKRDAGSSYATEADPCVWILNPWMLNKDRWNFDFVVSMKGEAVEDESGATALLNPCLHGTAAEHLGVAAKMLAVIPEYVSPRITAQRGAFTAFGDDPSELEDFGLRELREHPKSPALQAIVIPKNRATDIRYELDAAGVAESTIFPDIDGLATEIARRWDNPRM